MGLGEVGVGEAEAGLCPRAGLGRGAHFGCPRLGLGAVGVGSGIPGSGVGASGENTALGLHLAAFEPV